MGTEIQPHRPGTVLRFLAMMVDQAAPAEGAALWRVQKNGRELRCILVELPTGVDLRLMEGNDLRRTQLCMNESAAHTLSDRWRAAFCEVGWSGS